MQKEVHQIVLMHVTGTIDGYWEMSLDKVKLDKICAERNSKLTNERVIFKTITIPLI